VDDFSRASRDEIEWWRLAYLSKRFGKRMIGASDGFDLSAADWDLKITFYGLLSRLFIKDLRGKVKRGMRGAARRRTCLGRIPLGFARCVDRDELNNIRCGPDGLPIHKICVDPETRQYRQLMYALYTQKLWSVRRIAKHFNELKVEDWNGWTAVAIRRLLWSATAVGVFKWNQTRREFDREEEKWLVRNNPRIEWEVYYDPNLAIDSMDWWKAARKRLAAGRRKCLLTGRKPSRNRVSATTLFSGTLFCGYCGRELLLNRSAGKNKLMACPHGSKAMCGCQLSTSKNTR
jgi:DNA invertase Pin-like site-specific DNA recombinase